MQTFSFPARETTHTQKKNLKNGFFLISVVNLSIQKKKVGEDLSQANKNRLLPLFIEKIIPWDFVFPRRTTKKKKIIKKLSGLVYFLEENTVNICLFCKAHQ